jgi:hypothetical protein
VKGEPIGAALARARAFVAARGAALARARLAVVLGDAPRESLLAALRPLQAADGAFAVPGRTQGFAGTLAALAWLGDARALDAKEVEAAVRWLSAAQGEDGSWLPAPGACERARLVATGLVAGLLARTSCARPAPLRRAGVFLAGRWSPERVQGGDFGLLAAFAGFFANTAHELSDAALQWCGRELERGFRAGTLDALRVARVLALCDAAALPGAQLAPSEIVSALLDAQRPEGGWGWGAAADAGLEATLEAAAALCRLAGGCAGVPARAG